MNIYETIARIIEEIPAIGKNKKNSTQGFMFRGIDDVMNTIQPLFAKHKLFIVPEILEQTREDRQTSKGSNLIYSICKIKYTFYAEDGSNIQATVIGEGMDSGDKATNKAMAIAMKYVLFQVFCIPTEEMKDPDSECFEVTKQTEKKVNTKLTEKQKEIITLKIATDVVIKALEYYKVPVGDLTVQQASQIIKRINEEDSKKEFKETVEMAKDCTAEVEDAGNK